MATRRQVRNGAWVAGAAVVAVVAVLAVVLDRGTDDADEARPTDAPSSGASTAASAAPSPTASGDVPRKKATSAPKPKRTAPIPAEAEPVPLDETVRTGDGVRIAIVKQEMVKGKAKFAGEIGGPALRLTLEIRNGAKKPLDLDYVVVNAYTGKDRTPAAPIDAPGGRPLQGTLESGARADGVYLFSLGSSDRRSVTVGVDYRVGEPTVIFRGTTSS